MQIICGRKTGIIANLVTTKLATVKMEEDGSVILRTSCPVECQSAIATNLKGTSYCLPMITKSFILQPLGRLKKNSRNRFGGLRQIGALKMT